ncbi:hypothetical protein [Halorientalis sp.]|uniref:hypothetical protein n=1 Tax=Halorientalis sp. TaxID=1931229 RepID=UPI00262ADB56|nr:hypothetical protein [Halorientalis sp.]
MPTCAGTLSPANRLGFAIAATDGGAAVTLGLQMARALDRNANLLPCVRTSMDGPLSIDAPPRTATVSEPDVSGVT